MEALKGGGLALPAEFSPVLLKGAGGTVLADGGHAHDDRGTRLDRLPSPAERRELGSCEAGLYRIELDRWQCFGVLNGEHRDRGLARAVDDGGKVKLPPFRIGHRPE